MSEDTRWKQRYQNFHTALTRLQEAMNLEAPSELERNGLVQRFEFTIDLAWKVLKDFLVAKGFDFKPSPKDTLRQAAAAGYIDYAQELIDGLDIRNILSHDYDGDKFEESEDTIREQVYPALLKLNAFFTDQIFEN
jgi:nucleotidyltransferase substrate binding protein (TIGR01987 family)